MRYWVSAMLLASAMATPAFSQQAPDSDRHDHKVHDGGGGQGQGGRDRSEQAPQVQAAPQARPQQTPQPQGHIQQQDGGFQRGNDAGRGNFGRGQRPDGQPGSGGRPDRGVTPGNQPGPSNAQGDRNGRHFGNRPDDGVRVWNGDRNGSQQSRPDLRSGGDRNAGRDFRNGADSRGRDDRGRPGWNGGRPDGGRDWNRGWRQDRRYDWQGWRNSHREVYRAGRYRPPYGQGYGYRRFSAGIRIAPIFFAQDYWIDNPDYYRLPPAYGPYRWVRYYNDAVLVDIYQGVVVDVIPDFFW